MYINLVADNSVGSAPAGLTPAVQAAAAVFERDIPGNYTVNISYGWGTFDNVPDTDLSPSQPNDYSIGGPDQGESIDYGTLKQQLTSAAKVSEQISAVNTLPSTSPFAGNYYYISSSQQKALGIFYGNAGDIDGSIGFNTDDAQGGVLPTPYTEGAAIAEIAHALGLLSGDGENLYALDLYRYAAPGVRYSDPSKPDYFSLDSGNTDLANYDTSGFDPTLFQNDGSTDPLTLGGGGTDLTHLDLQTIDAMGFASDDVQFLLHSSANGQLFLGDVANGSVAYSLVGGYGNEFSFVGTGDYVGSGAIETLLYDSNNGAIYLGQIADAKEAFTLVGAVGSEWSFEASGAFTGTGGDDVLLHNTSGALVVGAVSNGQLSYSTIGGLGSEWSFGGQTDSTGAALDPRGLSGDFLGDGRTSFVIHNTGNGAFDIGEDVNNQASYTQVGGLGNEWQLVGAGDFLGQGKTDILMHNSNSGALYVADVQNGRATYTSLNSGLGSEWQAVGSGDYLHDGRAGVLIHSTGNGALDVMEVVNGTATYSNVSGLGSEWKLAG